MSGLAAAPGSDFAGLEPGFAEPVHAGQACFRAVLAAMAHPGQIVAVPTAPAGRPPAPLGPAALSVALTLFDLDTPVWLDPGASAAAAYLAFHCGAPLAAVDAARFALVADPAALPPLDSFPLGSDEYPERSATLVIEVAGLTNIGGIALRGPGLPDENRLGVAGLPARFWAERAALAELFPRGLDVLFTCGDRLAALPRSTRIRI